MVHLNELWAKYKDKGVVIVSITNEPKGLADKFTETFGAKYPIVVESSDSARNYGISGFPTQFAIGPDGKIVGDNFDPGLVESLLPKQRIAPTLPEKVATTYQKLVDKNKTADARKTLESAAGKGETDDEKTVAAYLKWLDDNAAEDLASAAESEKAGDYGEAAETYQQVVNDFPGLEPATKAADALKALLADPARKKEVDAAKALAKAKDEAVAENAVKKKIAIYEAVAKKWKDTKAGAKAAALVDELEHPKKK